MQNFRSSEEIFSEMKHNREKNQAGDSEENQEGGASRPAVDRLMVIIVQSQDVHRTTQALNKVGIYVTRLSSTGAFLGRRNTTLLIGLSDEQVELALSVIHENCRQRVEYVSTPLEGAPMPIPVATPITVGGATVFTLRVERFEEI
jgi:uncharacterized protein YaaQ